MALSVRPSVSQSVGWSVGDAFVKIKEERVMRIEGGTRRKEGQEEGRTKRKEGPGGRRD